MKSSARHTAAVASLAVVGSLLGGVIPPGSDAQSGGMPAQTTSAITTRVQMAKNAEITAYETRITHEIVSYYKHVLPADRYIDYGGDHVMLQETIFTKSAFKGYKRGAYVLQLYTRDGATKIDGGDMFQVDILEEAYNAREQGSIYELGIVNSTNAGGLKGVNWIFSMEYREPDYCDGTPYFDSKPERNGPTQQIPLNQSYFAALSTQGQHVLDKAFHRRPTDAEPLIGASVLYPTGPCSVANAAAS